MTTHPPLSRYFRFLTLEDMIPRTYRESGLERYYDEEHGWMPMVEAWAHDEFVLDPCRLTLFIGATGIDGDTFKNQYLMQRHGIQINKTSRNTVLFMTHVGTTRSSVAYLIEVLVKIAGELEQAEENSKPVERDHRAERVRALTRDLPPLPDFSRFHDAFRGNCDAGTPDGDMRTPYFLAGVEGNCEYLVLDRVEEVLRHGREPVSAKFVIPYPPGFPLLVPGQVVTPQIAEFMRKLDVKEIHGYEPDLGLRVFRDEVLARSASKTTRKRTVPAEH